MMSSVVVDVELFGGGGDGAVVSMEVSDALLADCCVLTVFDGWLYEVLGGLGCDGRLRGEFTGERLGSFRGVV